MCYCAYRPSYPERISCLFIEIILGFSLLGLLQVQFIFACLSLSCLWSFRDQNCRSPKIWLFKRNAATPVWLLQQKPHFLGVSRPWNGTTSSLLQYISRMWVYALCSTGAGSRVISVQQPNAEEKSLPLQVIVPQRKGCCKTRVLCWSQCWLEFNSSWSIPEKELPQAQMIKCLFSFSHINRFLPDGQW